MTLNINDLYSNILHAENSVEEYTKELEENIGHLQNVFLNMQNSKERERARARE